MPRSTKISTPVWEGGDWSTVVKSALTPYLPMAIPRMTLSFRPMLTVAGVVPLDGASTKKLGAAGLVIGITPLNLNRTLAVGSPSPLMVHTGPKLTKFILKQHIEPTLKPRNHKAHPPSLPIPP